MRLREPPEQGGLRGPRLPSACRSLCGPLPHCPESQAACPFLRHICKLRQETLLPQAQVHSSSGAGWALSGIGLSLPLAPWFLGYLPLPIPPLRLPHPTTAGLLTLLPRRAAGAAPPPKQLEKCPKSLCMMLHANQPYRARWWLPAWLRPTHLSRGEGSSHVPRATNMGGFAERMSTRESSRPRRLQSRLEPTVPSRGPNPSTTHCPRTLASEGSPPAPTAQTHPFFPHFLPHCLSFS